VSRLGSLTKCVRLDLAGPPLTLILVASGDAGSASACGALSGVIDQNRGRQNDPEHEPELPLAHRGVRRGCSAVPFLRRVDRFDWDASGNGGDIPEDGQHLSMLKILYGASAAALDAFRTADNPVDTQLVADLEKMVERTRLEIERLAGELRRS
jgi:hypothetical protein